ncbi:MAG TPA: coproporphyrinogen III oxidase family protein [Candidatus Olsenella avicola]|nr:coproporphyrinogen III oxidase family protein [Candidatus Olsenella avicola]
MISALYLHIPFCHAKCAYCDFDSRPLCGEALEEAASRYLDALLARIDAFGEAGALSEVRTAYVGGGTPTVLGPGLPELVRRVRSWCAPDELTCEANPESFDESMAAALAEAGATRVSLGVQTLDPAELRAIGRIHTAEQALAAVARARAAGLSVSCDLMCGLPGQSRESWRRTLAGIVAAAPDHVSVYPLTLEEGTPLAHRAETDPSLEPDADLQAWCMEEARRVLGAAGYHPYEVASYALPGRECAHNIAYWTGASYLGLGRSAAGMLGAGEWDALAALLGGEPAGEGTARVRYVQRDDVGTAFDVERLTAREAVAEDLMLGMRMTRGVGPELLSRARSVAGEKSVDSAVSTALSRGLAAWDAGGRLVPTERGWLLGNELYGLMWDLAADD